MKKSISSFILGLIFTLLGLGCAYSFWFIFILVGAFSSGIVKTIASTVPFINVIVYILPFIGSIICIKNAKIGKMLILIGAIISLICFITLFVALKSFSLTSSLFTIPTLILLVIGISKK